ncbi:glycoside hydrolase family 3 C-terminal domain-containing protein [Flavobacterium sp. CF136]|uniref:glycoside hydrolase family 3 C-terminal domain-containing protein n=1 Tax=Flavobacterium sp. (strain CF136) TaxID=1144313 RepID=UPI0002716BAA|nr:glycoside hydrolase family 3 C-terminal domain-containing protein [Flavobacterium sp. CF136]EJL64089.1 beta-glucosidase-like glycosyl hydrolase [Flavobacterium sp. CF136]
MRKVYCLVFMLNFLALNTFAQENFAFKNPNLTTEQRVDDLVSRMSIDEKISQLMDSSPAIERLGVPEYNWWNESLHGVARAGYATVFPQSISIASSWDRQLIFDVANVISDEARAKHHEYLRRGQHGMYQGLTFWSPNVNIFRDPRWGRGHETYGEDPFLTGQLGLKYVNGLQGTNEKYLKVIATAKHYAVHSGPEPSRHLFNAETSDIDLYETYLPAFRTLVKEGHVYSVMGAYNRFRGESCSASPFLFNILRNVWGFDGYIVSDCGAVTDIWKYHKITGDAATASALALKDGLDLECGSSFKSLKEAIDRKLISEADIDIAVKRLFTARFKLGMFDPEEIVSYAQIPYSVNNNSAHDWLARVASQKSIVLLKNQNNTLPLSRDIKTVAVIGPNANDVQSLWGNYSGVPSNPITVLKGIQNKLEPNTKVLYAKGTDLAKGVPAMKVVPSIYLQNENGIQGLTGEYFDNTEWQGKPLFTRIDDTIDFHWDIDTPDPRLKMGNYSVKWTGYIIAPKTGTYNISEWSKPFMTIEIETGKTSGGKNNHHPRIRPQKIELEAEKKYKITVKYQNFYGDAIAQLLWAEPQENVLQEAVQVAGQADAIVLVLGLNERLEGEEMKVEADGFEGGDRTSLDLPSNQEELMKAMTATGKPVILVLINGSALSINWANDHVPAILTAGYPGQQGGNAIADVLFGDYNPAGRLPVTYYKSTEQLPAFENYDMKGRTYRYFQKKPLYPFGFGLSYTKFKYSNLKLPTNVTPEKDFEILVDVTNIGERDGDEVIELYLKDEKASTPRPILQLEGFERVNLKKGETKTVRFTITPRQLSLINKKGQRVIEPGWFTISVGGKQPDGSEDTQNGRFNVTGKTVLLER